MRYNKINQKEYCCVPACLQMVLNRNKIKYQSQDEIGYDLGLIVPKDNGHLFKNARIGAKPSAGYGTQVDKESYSINNFFNKNNYPLIEEYYYITNYNEAKKLLEENKDNDILVCFHCATLYDNEKKDWGHVCVIDHIDNAGRITLLDPDSEKRFEIVQLQKLLDAIAKHGKSNRAGFWVIKKNLL